jgi:hypothetical protein
MSGKGKSRPVSGSPKHSDGARIQAGLDIARKAAHRCATLKLSFGDLETAKGGSPAAAAPVQIPRLRCLASHEAQAVQVEAPEALAGRVPGGVVAVKVRDEELMAAIARARGPALSPQGQLEWDETHGVATAERFWRLARFDAENEWDRLEHEREQREHLPLNPDPPNRQPASAWWDEYWHRSAREGKLAADSWLFGDPNIAPQPRRRPVPRPPVPTAGGLLTLGDALERLEGVRAAGGGRWRARCPVHGSRGPTLVVEERFSKPGLPHFHCYAGCHWTEIVEALR